jgi:quercetin dioxygenase-like cupin family protein
MIYEKTEVLLTPEDLEDIRDLQIPLEAIEVVNPHELPGFSGVAAEIFSKEPGVKAEAMMPVDVAGKALPVFIPKWWGHEMTYRNDGRYTMKLLHFEQGGHTSMHFHVHKHETLMVVSGVLTLETLFNKQRNYYRLPRGVAWVVAPGYAHRLIAAEGPVDLVEASTYDDSLDSIRLS